MIDFRNIWLRMSPGILVVTCLSSALAYAEVKNDKVTVGGTKGHPGLTGAVKYPNSEYTVTCWQEGKQVLQNQGKGNIALSKEFVARALSISTNGRRGPVLTIFSTDTAICRLQTTGKSK